MPDIKARLMRGAAPVAGRIEDAYTGFRHDLG